MVGAYLRDREEDAFLALYRRHSSGVYGTILRLVRGDVEEAKEILQLTWIRAAENLHRFRWESSLRSWLTGIAVNCHRGALRQRRRRPTEPIESVEIAALPEVRSDRVAELKRQIEAGTYHVSADEIADAMLEQK